MDCVEGMVSRSSQCLDAQEKVENWIWNWRCIMYANQVKKAYRMAELQAETEMLLMRVDELTDRIGEDATKIWQITEKIKKKLMEVNNA